MACNQPFLKSGLHQNRPVPAVLFFGVLLRLATSSDATPPARDRPGQFPAGNEGLLRRPLPSHIRTTDGRPQELAARMLLSEASAKAPAKQRSDRSLALATSPEPDSAPASFPAPAPERRLRGGAPSPAPEKGTPKKLKAFVEPLPVPRQLIAPNGGGTVTIGAFKILQQVHPDLPPTEFYAFGTSEETAAVPGPTIVAQRGTALSVAWRNNISDSEHLLTVDLTLGVPKPKMGGIPISVHVHGAVVHSSSDGHPDAWWTKGGETGPTFNNSDHVYPNTQPGATLWYHDHTVGMTRLNVAAGLAGFYLLRDEAQESELGLPQGDYDIPLALQDKSFDVASGRIVFPARGDNPEIHPHWLPEYLGEFILVNGKIAPFLDVEPGKYRLRILNAGNARFFVLKLELTTPGQKKGAPLRLLPFTQIASDCAFLPSPIRTQQLVLGPGERAEVIVDFSGLPLNASVRVANSAAAPYEGGDPPVGPQRDVMLFVVSKPLNGTDTRKVPGSLAPLTRLDPESAPVRRVITLTETANPKTDSPEVSLLEGLHWTDSVVVTPRLGGTEIWELINLTDDWHPFHIHFAPHQLLHRQELDVEGFKAGNCSLDGANGTASCLKGGLVAPVGAEVSWKDTTKVPSGMVTSLIIRFASVDGETLPFDPTSGPGYVFHCHILDHEDNDMMRPFTLLNAVGMNASELNAAGILRVKPYLELLLLLAIAFVLG